MNQNSAIVPAVDVDLFWHTHQLTETKYLLWCAHHVGFLINHDDTVGESELTTSLDNTIGAWQAAYSENCLNPSPGSVSCTFPAVPAREQTTLDKTPPAGLTPAQLTLWCFDVKHQDMHERLDFYLLQKRMELKNYNGKLAKSPPAPSLSSSEAKGGGGSLMKRFAQVAKSELVGNEHSKLGPTQRG